MKAVRFDQYGGVDVLKVVDAPVPEPKASDGCQNGRSVAPPRRVLVDVTCPGLCGSRPCSRSVSYGRNRPAWDAVSVTRRCPGGVYPSEAAAHYHYII
jgi:hypothetical protein